MYLRSVAGTALGVALCLLSAPAFACDGARDCYERVRVPDEFRTVEREVVLRRGYDELIETPPVYGTRFERVEIAPGRHYREFTPTIYADVRRTEMVVPPRVSYAVAPAVTRTVYDTVVVRRGSVRWERSRDVFGRERRCRVRVPAVTRTVAREIVVASAERVPVVYPAVYRDVLRPVVVRPAQVRSIYVTPAYGWIRRDVMISPGSRFVVSRPPVIGIERREVRVRRAGFTWRRTGW